MRSKPSSSGATGRGASIEDIGEIDLELGAHRLRVDRGRPELRRRRRPVERLPVGKLELGVVAVARVAPGPEDQAVTEGRLLDAAAELDVLRVALRVGHLCVQYERSDHLLGGA